MPTGEVSILNEWQQGDLALSPMELPCVELEDGAPVVAFMEAPFGVAVITQTCDIIKGLEIRPDVHVAVLIRVEPHEIARIIKGDRPSQVIVPGLEGLSLAIDLDSVATVSKLYAATWVRTVGCPTDEAQRAFARQLARHRQRFAFPDAYQDDVLRQLRRWVEDKRKSQGDHGVFIRETEEFRVSCDKWSNPTEMTLLALVKRTPTEAELFKWQSSLNCMIGKGKYDQYPRPTGRIVTFSDLSAQEYRDSDRLDWDGLSDV